MYGEHHLMMTTTILGVLVYVAPCTKCLEVPLGCLSIHKLHRGGTKVSSPGGNAKFLAVEVLVLKQS